MLPNISKLTLLTLIHTLTILASPTLPRELLPREDLEGSCPSRHLPSESQYIAGVPSFCSYYNPTPQNPNPVKLITSSEPLVGTIQLRAYDNNEFVYWVYKISIQDTVLDDAKEVSYEKCMRKMREVLTEGKLGDAYCVVDGTEDVLFKGGKLKEGLDTIGNLVFEGYKRRGKDPV